MRSPRAEHRYLRTTRHPAAAAVVGAISFDHVYEAADSIDDVYPAIVERPGRGRRGDTARSIYAVPGSPVVAERTVELLLADDRVRTVVLPALSFLDLAWARLGIDPIAVGARVVDGHRFEVEAAGERGPLLVAQCDSLDVLSAVKLAIGEALDTRSPLGQRPRPPPGRRRPRARRRPLPDDLRLTVIQRLGLPDEHIVDVAWDDLDRDIEPDHLTSVWIPTYVAPVAFEVQRFAELVATLRRECPWDQEQTHESLKRHLLEEAYEVIDALDGVDEETGEGYEHLEEELGDLLFQILFHATLASEAGQFTLADVARGVHDKLHSRHPHVFGQADADDAEQVAANWEDLKKAEKGRSSVFDGIPDALPALLYALKVQKKAAALGVGSTIGDGTAGIAGAPTDRLGGRRTALAARRCATPRTASRRRGRRAARRRAAVQRGRPGPGRRRRSRDRRCAPPPCATATRSARLERMPRRRHARPPASARSRVLPGRRHPRRPREDHRWASTTTCRRSRPTRSWPRWLTFAAEHPDERSNESEVADGERIESRSRASGRPPTTTASTQSFENTIGVEMIEDSSYVRGDPGRAPAARRRGHRVARFAQPLAHPASGCWVTVRSRGRRIRPTAPEEPAVKTTVTDLLGIDVPILAFRHCRDVVAAVSKAGGLGVLGAVAHTPEQLEIDLSWIEDEVGDKPYGVDLIVPAKYAGDEDGGYTLDDIASLIPAEQRDLRRRHPAPLRRARAAGDDAEPAGRSLTASAPRPSRPTRPGRSSTSPWPTARRSWPTPSARRRQFMIDRVKEEGRLVGALAGKAVHAERHVQAGVDIIIAQGSEAGGHTGEIGSMVLIPEVVDAVAPVPVLGAGGIGRGRQMAAAMALGAQGVWCGSVWLTTDEAETHPAVKAEDAGRHVGRHHPLPLAHRQAGPHAALGLDRRVGAPGHPGPARHAAAAHPHRAGAAAASTAPPTSRAPAPRSWPTTSWARSWAT